MISAGSRQMKAPARRCVDTTPFQVAIHRTLSRHLPQKATRQSRRNIAPTVSSLLRSKRETNSVWRSEREGEISGVGLISVVVGGGGDAMVAAARARATHKLSPTNCMRSLLRWHIPPTGWRTACNRAAIPSIAWKKNLPPHLPSGTTALI